MHAPYWQIAITPTFLPCMKCSLPWWAGRRLARVDSASLSILCLLCSTRAPSTVGADLAVTPLGDALKAKGFDLTKPALFTCEGILCYLPQVCTRSGSYSALMM